MPRIRVNVYKRATRKNYEATWRDPVTHEAKTKTTGTPNKREAERFAAKLEKSIEDGDYSEPSRITWQELREAYEIEVFPEQAPKTIATTKSTLNAIDDILRIRFASAFDTAQVRRFKREIRKKNVSEFTVKRHLSELRKILRWAHRCGLIETLPQIDMPRARGSKGRPITAEELDRVIEKVVTVVGEASAESWIYLLKGLWFSGLRLGESMLLHWTDDSNFTVDFDHKYPMFRIRAATDKSRKDRLFPMAP